MPAKIRLQRHGRKGYAFYHIVIADSRAPRDGRYIERIGSYDPNTNPATITLDFDKAIDWLAKGAQPTDTAKSILSYKGVLYKKHLLGGVKKGAFTEEEGERRFQVWMTEKEAKIQAKKNHLSEESEASKKSRLEAEVKVNQDRADALAKKIADEQAIIAAKAKEAEDAVKAALAAKKKEVEAAAEKTEAKKEENVEVSVKEVAKEEKK
ncbi:MAG: 30S ribosomal protein S16 [Prolixibacteraceae bacterium]|nr:30S ribosomal protein S16 [Prolixibacteraceae bacterium]